MTELERLQKRLTDMSAVDFHVTPGPGPFTAEELCREINSAFDQMENGTATVTDSFNDDAVQVNVRSALSPKLVPFDHDG